MAVVQVLVGLISTNAAFAFLIGPVLTNMLLFLSYIMGALFMYFFKKFL